MVDYNRAGCALLEIVSSPDMRSGEEAAAYVRKVQRILRCGSEEQRELQLQISLRLMIWFFFLRISRRASGFCDDHVGLSLFHAL